MKLAAKAWKKLLILWLSSSLAMRRVTVYRAVVDAPMVTMGRLSSSQSQLSTTRSKIRLMVPKNGPSYRKNPFISAGFLSRDARAQPFTAPMATPLVMCLFRQM